MTTIQERKATRAFLKEVYAKNFSYIEIKCKNDAIIKAVELLHRYDTSPYITCQNCIDGKQYLYAAYNGVYKKLKEPFQYMPSVIEQDADGKTSKCIIYDCRIEYERISEYIYNHFGESYNIIEQSEIIEANTPHDNLYHDVITLTKKRIKHNDGGH